MRSYPQVVFALVSICGAGPSLGPTQAHATVQVSIDLSRQRMHVESSRGHYDWPISSARSGFTTPGGSFAPTHLARMHYSRKYDMSPMPHAIFFHGGYAIHGSYAVGSLGRPASHGCVRLAPGNAAALYGLVKAEGARISISGTPPASQPLARHSYARQYYARDDLRAYGRRRATRPSYRDYGYGDVEDGPRAPYGYRPFYNHPAYFYAPQVVGAVPYED